MLTESLFVFPCKETQKRANIELGEVKGIYVKILS